MKKSTTRAVSCFYGLLILAACTDVQLLPKTFDVELSGEYCPKSSSDQDVPIRVVFILDNSESMLDADPEGIRVQKAKELIQNFSDNTNMEFAVVRFGDNSLILTQDGFTKDAALLDQALSQPQFAPEGFTNYLAALNDLRTLIENDQDIFQSEFAAELQLAQEQGLPEPELIAPYYVGIFLSDGRPLLSTGVQQETELIGSTVERILEMQGEFVAGIKLHTAYLEDPFAEDHDSNRERLNLMATRGGGTFTNFTSGEDIDFNVFDFKIFVPYDIPLFFIHNPHIILTETNAEPDTDGDGLFDRLEIEELGTHPILTDTDNDGCDDFVEFIQFTNPLDPADNRCGCTTNELKTDTDGDGLADCLEMTFKLNPQDWDTDHDLYPDFLEFRRGTNPKWDETQGGQFVDPDGDMVASLDELYQGTNPLVNDLDIHSNYKVVYSQLGTSPNYFNQTHCRTGAIQNVPVVPLLNPETFGDGKDPMWNIPQNEVMAIAVETPKTNPRLRTLQVKRLTLEHGAAAEFRSIETSTDSEYLKVGDSYVPLVGD